ncbi:MAG: TetR/AcrR family transcriptional regulator [Bacteroidetes bacterium]|nr:TetR/AcrR family transcriptional regulator [Bacteroidota bacterium]MDA1121595.1 TetR/AcrR family transcriptional regulator [Bacteroidota bacterium]
MDNKEKIIVKADELFRLYGVKSITMDEIARELGMSKKTIYQYFKDKDEIVYEATQHILDHDKCEFEAIQKEAPNSIEELLLLSKCLRRNFENMNPSILFDLKRYYPRAWDLFIAVKENFFKESVRRTLKRGIKEGNFRPEIHIEVLTILRLEQVQMSFDPRIFPRDKFDFKEVQMQFFDHFVNGIMTEKGRKYYYELFHLETVK